MKAKIPLIVVEVEGGVVQTVYVEGRARVFVADFDNLKADANSERWCVEMPTDPFDAACDITRETVGQKLQSKS